MIQRLSNYVVNIFLITLLTISLIGAITQASLMQEVLSSKKNIVYTILVLIFVLIFIFRKKFNKLIEYLFTSKKRFFLTCIIAFLCLIFYQLNIIQALTGSMDLDPAFIYSLIIGKPMRGSSYFSWYPNLLLLLNIENAFYKLLGKPDIYIYLKSLNYVNMVLIDLGLVFITLTVKKQLGRGKAFLTLVASIFLFGITPHIVIPYSDNWAFFLTSLYIFLLSTSYTNKKFNFKPALLFCMGITSALIYKIKPSTTISLIATLLIIVVFMIKNKKEYFNFLFIKKSLKALIIFVLPFCLTISVCNYYAHNNGLVKIEKGYSASPLHFMAMGLHGDGGYWQEFNDKDQALPRELKKDYEINAIKKDIKDFRSFSNFVTFLIRKQQSNTDLASWQRNSGPISWNVSPKLKVKNHFQFLLRKVFIQNNYFQWNGVLAFIQLIWIFVIALMTLSWKNDDFFVQILKYTAIGGFLFLLLFEGDTSRYMIQYLPIMLVLSSYGINELLSE